MRSVYRTVVVKKELSRKAKLSIYRSIYVPTLTYGHELWVMTERTRSRIQAAEMSFLRRVAGRSLRDRVRSSVTREELGVEPLLLRIERSQLRWLGHLFRMPPGRLPREVFQACPTGRRPRGRPRTRWRNYVSRLAGLGTPRVPPEELEEVSGDRTINSGKSKGGGVCFMVNNKWCSDVEIISTGCSPDLEHLMIRCRPYYLPREFTSVVMTAVYVPPHADNNKAMDELFGVIEQDRDLTAGGCVYCSRRL
ncbi:hypothetical protein L3Q82_004596 [Scortum barcoo]|uniref:Uncharacterized protein n=1 Tax=Scortum barcoo TaxID=214431 RepID=A0ACB8VGJ0_9TELE|nr:hypothetical protein L3Q82_004596 [Scortum barcoo]